MFLGAETMRGAIQRFVPKAWFITRPRFSDLAYTGAKKLTRLPRRSAVVGFSAEDVYGIAEIVRRQRGGAAVVLGALSPRTRNAQVALYQSGEVDFLVATDAIGMGLNMDVDHVAFAGAEKFDGRGFRPLTPAEMGQIAGRAGRYMNDGTFGVTGECEPFDEEMVSRVESHRYDPVKVLQWRNSALAFHSLPALLESLDAPPPERGLARARPATDAVALHHLANEAEIRALATSPRQCQAAVGGLPASRFPQIVGRRTCQDGAHAVPVPDGRAGPHPRRLDGAADRAAGCGRRRCRDLVGTAGADPHLHLCREPPRLDSRRQPLARRDPRGGRPALRCAA